MAEKGVRVKPRIIIHGGAGNISHETIPPEAEAAYRTSLLKILRVGQLMLDDGGNALDVATHAVKLFEDNPLFNCGKGAVFTRDGTNELEASVMVSRGYRKRGVGCMCLKKVKHPILLAKEMLIKGEASDGKAGGAYGHSQLFGETLESLAKKWGLEMVDPGYFWTQKRWDEHKRGLEREREHDQQSLIGPNICGGDPSWSADEYLPQGTVGAVVLDRFGTLCVATSTGGLTNKLSGRIGDTPTLGAGFWAEEWQDESRSGGHVPKEPSGQQDILSLLTTKLNTLLRDCLPTTLIGPTVMWRRPYGVMPSRAKPPRTSYSSLTRAVAMSGTGNGDSFLRVNAVRTAGAMVRFSNTDTSLATAITRVAGPGGELQKSADDRFGTGEGEGGIIGIEVVGDQGIVSWDFNCGGLFRAWIDDAGLERCMMFRDT